MPCSRSIAAEGAEQADDALLHELAPVDGRGTAIDAGHAADERHERIDQPIARRAIAALGGPDELALALQREAGGRGTIADGLHGYAGLTSIRRGRSCSGFGILTVRTPSRSSASMCSASASPGSVMW